MLEKLSFTNNVVKDFLPSLLYTLNSIFRCQINNMQVTQNYFMTKTESHDLAYFFMAFGSKLHAHVNYKALCNMILKSRRDNQRVSLMSTKKEYSLISTIYSDESDRAGAVTYPTPHRLMCRAVSYILEYAPQLLYVRGTLPIATNNNDTLVFASSLRDSGILTGCAKLTRGEFIFHALHSPNDHLCAMVQRHLLAYGVKLFTYPFFRQLPAPNAINKTLASTFYKDLLCEIDAKIPVVHPLFPVLDPGRATAERRVKIINKKWRIQTVMRQQPREQFFHAFAVKGANATTLHIIASGSNIVDNLEDSITINNVKMRPTTKSQFGHTENVKRYIYTYSNDVHAQSVKVGSVTALLLDGSNYTLSSLELRSTSSVATSRPAANNRTIAQADALKDLRKISLADIEALGTIFSHFVFCDITFNYNYCKLIDKNGTREIVRNANQAPINITTALLMPAKWCEYVKTSRSQANDIMWSLFVFLFNGRAPPTELNFPGGGTQWRIFLDAFSTTEMLEETARQAQSVAELCLYSRAHYNIDFQGLSSAYPQTMTGKLNGSSVTISPVRDITKQFKSAPWFTCDGGKSALVGVLIFAHYAVGEFMVGSTKYTIFTLRNFRSRIKTFETDTTISTTTLADRNLPPIAVQADAEDAEQESGNLVLTNLSAFGAQLEQRELAAGVYNYTNRANTTVSVIYRHIVEEEYTFTISYKTREEPHHVVTIELELKR